MVSVALQFTSGDKVLTLITATVKAEMTDGLLKVSIPKQVTQPETAKIAIA